MAAEALNGDSEHFGDSPDVEWWLLFQFKLRGRNRDEIRAKSQKLRAGSGPVSGINWAKILGCEEVWDDARIKPALRIQHESREIGRSVSVLGFWTLEQRSCSVRTGLFLSRESKGW